MKRVEGSAGVSLLECTNPVKNKWRIRWDVQKKEDGSASYMEEEFNHKPTDEEILTRPSFPDSHTRKFRYGCPARTSSTTKPHTILPSKREGGTCR